MTYDAIDPGNSLPGNFRVSFNRPPERRYGSGKAIYLREGHRHHAASSRPLGTEPAQAAVAGRLHAVIRSVAVL